MSDGKHVTKNSPRRTIRDEVAVRSKQRARKVEAFLHVGRDGRALQRAAHLLGDRHEAVRKDAELNRVAHAVRALELGGG